MEIIGSIIAMLLAFVFVWMGVRKNEEKIFEEWYTDKFVPYLISTGADQFETEAINKDVLRVIIIFEQDPQKVLELYFKYSE